MTDIFTEVDESVRQDKIAKWWTAWRPFIYGGMALLVGSVAVNEFILRPQAERRMAARAGAFEAAVKAYEQGQYAEAEKGFAALVQNEPRLAPIAAHYLALTRYEGNGDAEGAVAALSQAGGYDDGPFGRLAMLKAAYFRADTQSLPELEASLGGLLTDEGPLGALARELVAAKAFEVGDVARARREYNRLAFDPAAPPGVIQRAEIALAAMPLANGEADPAGAASPSPSQPAEPAPGEE